MISFAENWAAFVVASEGQPERVTDLLRRAEIDQLSDLPAGQELRLPGGC